MMEMVSGWEWLILMAGAVICVGVGVVAAIVQEIRRK